MEPKIGTSTYVVNNSLICCLPPKRASFDIKLYLQLHKKIMRKANIQKKFEESVYHLAASHANPRKGFEGKLRPGTFLSRSSSVRDKDRRVYTEENRGTQESVGGWEQSSWGKGGREEDGPGAQSGWKERVKPNMMYNLSLYRKGFKHSSFKKERMCLTIMENLQRTKREMTQDKQDRNCNSTKMRTTIS